MIARFKCQLPTELSIPISQYNNLDLVSINIDDMEVFLHPPYQSIEKIQYSEKAFIGNKSTFFQIQEPPIISKDIKIDGLEIINTNLIFIDFKKQSFDRSTNKNLNFDPSLETIEKVLTQYIQSIRTVTQASGIKAQSINSFPWSIQYLNDDHSELPIIQGLFRQKVRGQYKISYININKKIWNQIKLQIENSAEPFIWESLYLDALASLPDTGAAITLTYASLENLIGYALEYFAKKQNIPTEIWAWIKQPARDFRKEPSVADLYTEILHMLTGKSLKDERQLWQLFIEIKKSRNSLVHEGIARDSSGKRLTEDGMERLVKKAEKIIEWIEEQLPEENQRKRNKEKIRLEGSFVLNQTK